MPSYISSNSQRLYVALEPEFGQTAALTGAHRIPAVKFGARQRSEALARRDKTGTRTFRGVPASGRKKTNFSLKTYMAGWGAQAAPPAYGALFQGALGAAPQLYAGAVTGLGSTAKNIVFAGPHGLSVGQAITFGGEIRFVAALADPLTVVLNQGFSTIPAAGSPVGATASYRPGNLLPSMNVFEYRSPETALKRFVSGGVVDQMTVTINGDFHEFQFEGVAQDLVDSASFSAGIAGLTNFPEEPAHADFDYAVVPGNLGQAWLGNAMSKFCTITNAQLTVQNNVEVRDTEFGCDCALAAVPGERLVSLTFSLFEQDDAATQALYQAARQRTPVSVMFQLGQQAGQLFGVWVTGMVPDIPDFDDSDTRVIWRFDGARAQGTVDDEIYIAFG